MISKELSDLVSALGAFGIMVQAVDVTPLPPPPVDPPPVVIPPSPTGVFTVSGGVLLGPDGKPFLARGININDSQMSEVVSNDACEPLLSLFPGLNFIRLACRSYANVSVYEPFIGRVTKKGIVVVFDDHTGISKPPYTGSQLAAETDWFARVAARYIDNTYVWLGGFNEPGNGNDLAGITAQQVAIYNAIRKTGSKAINLLELPSGGNPGLVGTAAKGYDGKGPMTASEYLKMTNIVWGPHFYAWMAKYSTDRTVMQAAFTGSVASAAGVLAVKSMKSADGDVPVIIGEFGDSTVGQFADPDGALAVDVVGTSGYGFGAWHWNANPTPGQLGDRLVDGGKLTAYGKQLAALIARAANISPTIPPVVVPPANATTVSPGDGKVAVDSAGAQWSITADGSVSKDNVLVPGGSGTSSLSIVNGVAVATDSKTRTQFTWDGAKWNAVGGTTPPLPTPTGPGTAGKWLDGAVPGMKYKVLLPNNYDSTVHYPVVVYLHQLDWGIPSDVPMLQASLDKWFNASWFRSQFPCIVVAPLLDQSADRGGTTINFGGVSSGVTAGRDMAFAVIQAVVNAYSTGKIVVTGNSLGGIGSWELVANKPDLFAAAMPMAGASYSRDVNTTADALKDKPIWAIHGSNDTNVPLTWDRAMYARMKSIGGKMMYTEKAGVGHDVWDSAYTDPQYLTWLLTQ